VTQQKLNLLQFAACLMAQVRRKSCGATVGKLEFFAFNFTIVQITLGVKPCPQILPALLMDRSNEPLLMPAPRVQL